MLHLNCKFSPHKKDEEVYLFGNPPYLGYPKQDKQQKQDMENVFLNTNIKYKKLDYITCWFVKGVRYLRLTKARLCFVSTNSICQGEQVSILWPSLLKISAIDYAYKTFKWSNSAKNNLNYSPETPKSPSNT